MGAQYILKLKTACLQAVWPVFLIESDAAPENTSLSLVHDTTAGIAPNNSIEIN